VELEPSTTQTLALATALPLHAQSPMKSETVDATVFAILLANNLRLRTQAIQSVDVFAPLPTAHLDTQSTPTLAIVSALELASMLLSSLNLALVDLALETGL